MDDYKLKYEEIKLSFERYQKTTENKIQELSKKNTQYEKDLDMLSNIILISNYINSNLSSSNIIQMINDTIIGVMGVTQSSIYLQEDDKFIIKITNGSKESIKLTDKCKSFIRCHKIFIINSKDFITRDLDKGIEIHSRIGVPIKIKENFIGYIVVDHTHYNFFSEFHKGFISAIASQIAIAIENSILYKKIENAAKKDVLLDIYNRKTFYEIINNRLKLNDLKEYAIVMMDLDNFKKINDTLGHQFGDKVLVDTTKLIKSMVDINDIIARYGGEEIILFIDFKEDKRLVYNKIEKIREAISKNYIKRDDLKINISASFGIGFYPDNGLKLEEVINTADKYMYKSKKLGKNLVTGPHLNIEKDILI